MKTTIIYYDIEFDVEFDYQPEEAMVMYYADGSGYPGCAEAVEGVHSMEHKGTDFLDLIYDGNEEEIDELILESIHENKY